VNHLLGESSVPTVRALPACRRFGSMEPCAFQRGSFALAERRGDVHTRIAGREASQATRLTAGVLKHMSNRKVIAMSRKNGSAESRCHTDLGVSHEQRPFSAEYLFEDNISEDHGAKSMTFTGLESERASAATYSILLLAVDKTLSPWRNARSEVTP
jgi:hypothetical protein